MREPQHPQSGTTQSGSTQPAAHRGPLGRPVLLLAAGVVVLSGAYGVGHLAQAVRLLADAISSSRNSDLPVLGTVFYGISGLAAFLLMLALLRSFDLVVGHFRDTSPLRLRAAKPVEQFIDEAAAVGISPRVARESYYLLEPQYPHKMCIDLNDNLRTELRLPDEAIRALDALLRTRCDRRQEAATMAAKIGVDAAATPLLQSLVSVFDLLKATDTSPPMCEDRSGSRDRAADAPASNASRERRLSDSAQRKALHAATLSAIETGSLHDQDSSGLHPQFNDYSGPRRRATDNRLNADDKAPRERASDQMPDRTSDRTPGRAFDRTLDRTFDRTFDAAVDRAVGRAMERPPASSSERKAQTTAAPEESSQRDAVFVASRANRAPGPTR